MPVGGHELIAKTNLRKDQSHSGYGNVSSSQPAGRNSIGTDKWKWWTGIIALVCGAELVVIAVIGGAGIGAFFGLNGAFVAAFAAATLAFTFRSWRAARRRSVRIKPGSY